MKGFLSTKTKKKKLIIFFNDSNNMLYAKEDKQNRSLKMYCKSCSHIQDADQNLVYRNEISHPTAERTTIIQDLTSDPTLPRDTKQRCPECSGNEAVYFQSSETNKQEGMILYYVCTNPDCGHRWVSR